jgi:hypothetical protein
MTNCACTVSGFGAPSASWSQPRSTGSSLAGAVAYSLSLPAAAAANHTQKRFTMAGTDIDGWPLGPRDGTSG